MIKNRTMGLSNWLLKLFILCALYFPIFTTAAKGKRMGHFPEIIGAVVLAVLFAVVSLPRLQKHSKNRIMVLWFIGALVLYNIVSFYANVKYQHVYWEQINVTASYVFFIVLLAADNKGLFREQKVIRFTMLHIIISNILGLLYYYMGYFQLTIHNVKGTWSNWKIWFREIDPNFYEKRFNWIYQYKCNYAFMLLVFFALFTVYRKRFARKIYYIGSLLVIFACLIVGHTYSSTLMVVLILGGAWLDDYKDKIRSFAGWKKVKAYYFLVLIPIIAAGALLVKKMLGERNIFTLGSRTFIWKNGIRTILEHPWGVGKEYYSFKIELPEVGWVTNNCHNVFLNEMFRFSIIAGLAFTLLFLLIIVYTIKRNPTFLSVGIWLAFLIPLNMDYALLVKDLPLFLFMVYCIFFHKPEKEELFFREVDNDRGYVAE